MTISYSSACARKLKGHLNEHSITAALQILAYVYPAYLCIKDVDRGKPSRLKLWCMYWCVGHACSCRCMSVCLQFKRGRDFV